MSNMQSNISAVIFDCDGVMFDSRQANINFYNHILSHFISYLTLAFLP